MQSSIQQESIANHTISEAQNSNSQQSNMIWPPIQPEHLNEIVACLSEISDTRLPKPNNQIAKEHFLECTHHSDEAIQSNDSQFERLRKSKKLADKFEFDLRHISAVKELNTSDIKSFAESSIHATNKAVQRLESVLQNYMQFSELSTLAMLNFRESDKYVEIDNDVCIKLKNHGVTLSQNSTALDLYEKLSEVWSIKENELIQSMLCWLFTDMEGQRLIFYFGMKNHLNSEALLLSQDNL